jgi:hypothetical protein
MVSLQLARLGVGILILLDGAGGCVESFAHRRGDQG